MADPGLRAYESEMQELRDWLATGAKTAADFDGKYRGTPFLHSTTVKAIDPESYILGSITQGIGPNTWAGRLDLLQHLIRLGEVEHEERDGTFIYRLSMKQ